MLTQEDYWMIKELHERGMYRKDIADRLGVHPKMITRALKQPGVPSRRRQKYAKLKPYLGKVDELLAAGVYNAVVIYREIQALGYSGKIRVLRSYIEPKRILRPSKATVRFETQPGHQLQHDWGELKVPLAGVVQKVYIAVNTLGYSRRFHVVAARRCDAEHTYESLVRAFAWFGGVPRQVWVENQKSAVLKHVPGAVQFNPRFKQLACHYDFVPKACRPYRARTKAKVERPFRYIREDFFLARFFRDMDDLNTQFTDWLATVANARCHGTTRRVVSEAIAEEQEQLGPLPAMAFNAVLSLQRRVSHDGMVSVNGNRYSVPDCTRRRVVEVQTRADEVRIYEGSQLLAVHPVLEGRGQTRLAAAGHTGQAIQQPGPFASARTAGHAARSSCV